MHLLVDVGMVLWLAGSVVAAVLVTSALLDLRQLSDTMESSAVAMHETAKDLNGLSRVPLIGKRLRAAEAFARSELPTPAKAFAGVTGAVPARAAEGDAITGALPAVEAVSLALVFLIVGLLFRSPVAPLVALAGSGVSYVVAVHTVPHIADALGLASPNELEPLVVVLLVGIVTDYTIFYLHSFQRHLHSGSRGRDAVVRAIAETAPIVLTAAFTVAVSTAALVVARLPLFHNLGPGMALTVVVGGAAAVTLLPALVAVLGPVALWPSARRRAPWPGGRRSLRGRLASLATRRPAAAAVVAVSVAGLLLVAWPLRGAHLGTNLVAGLPSGSEPRRAARAAAASFPPGIVAPTEVVVAGRDVASRRGALVAFQHELERQPGVAGVVGPADLPLPFPVGVAVSRSGDAARYVLLLRHDPYSAQAIDAVQRMRHHAGALLIEAGLPAAHAAFAGDTALSADVVALADHDLLRIAIAILVLDVVVLIVFLRALLAPVLVLAASLLVVLVSLSLANAVFSWALGIGGLTFYVPFAVAVLLIAFGSDYNVYVVGTIWKDAERASLREAVVRANFEAAPAVSAAGITLALTFGALALVPVSAFRQAALAMTAGILLDTFVVRPYLVPALISVFGRASAWPNRRVAGGQRRRERRAVAGRAA